MYRTSQAPPISASAASTNKSIDRVTDMSSSYVAGSAALLLTLR